MKRGTIVLTEFPYTDLSASKRRPAVIVSRVHNSSEDVVVAFISSVVPVHPKPTEYVLTRQVSGFEQTGLTRDSVLRMDKLVTLSPSIFTGELGDVTEEMQVEIDGRLIIALDLLKRMENPK
ncbi:MAG: type II toxin-antitoxin system PemK/MazF family toxin [Bacteroidota bacterium]